MRAGEQQAGERGTNTEVMRREIVREKQGEQILELQCHNFSLEQGGKVNVRLCAALFSINRQILNSVEKRKGYKG